MPSAMVETNIYVCISFFSTSCFLSDPEFQNQSSFRFFFALSVLSWLYFIAVCLFHDAPVITVFLLSHWIGLMNHSMDNGMTLSVE